jgi:alpha-1,6-rhamnosyltransferase
VEWGSGVKAAPPPQWEKSVKNLTIIVPFRNGHATLGKLLGSIPRDIPVIVVDDVSDKPLDPLPDSRTQILRLGQRGYFSGAANAGIEACTTDVLVINQDAWLDGNTWQAQVRGWQMSEYAIAGDGVMGHPAWPRGYVQGTCMFLGRAAIEKVGLLNERDYPLWGATAEWQLRACRAGLEALPCEVGGFNHARKGNYGASISAAMAAEPNKRELFIRTPPAISVVIVCHNYGRYIGDAMASLFGGQSCLGERQQQTFQSFEVIIIDDASTDDSWKIIEPLADAWRGVRVMRNAQTLGTAATLNVAIKTAYGKYVTFLSADDMMETHRLERLYRVAEENPHRVIYDDLQLFKQGQRFEKMPLPEYDFDKTLHKNQMHAGIFYEKRAWQECNGYPEIMRDGREDWAINVALGARGYCGVHVPEAMYLYRREGQNRSVHNVSAQWYQNYRAQMQSLYPDLYQGERPTMCCGGGKTKSKARTAPGGGGGVTYSAVGSDGMTLLEYLGGKGPSTFYATAPHQTYVYGGKYHYFWVDNRHVAKMLGAMEGRHTMFRRGVLPKPHLDGAAIAAETEVAKELESVPVITAPVIETPTVADEKPATAPKRYAPKKKTAEAPALECAPGCDCK